MTEQEACGLDSRFHFAVESIRSLQEEGSRPTVFDVGSGKALLKDDIERLGFRYCAFDMSPETHHVRQWNLEHICPAAEQADIVVLLEVLEHLDNPWLGMRNVAAVLRPGGFLIMTTPNPSWSDSRLSLAARGVLTMFTRDDLDVNHHVFTPWKHVVERCLADHGFTDLKFTPLGGRTTFAARPLWDWKMPLRLGVRLLKVLIERWDAASVGPLYGITARRKA